MSEAPLRIGVLGASRIADDAIVAPARNLGHRLVAVAARDRDRAEEFAARHGVERVLDGYQDVIDDPEVDVIYNPLVNSLHAEWNLAAIAAGKPVLTEKPFAANSESARTVAAAAHASGVLVLEGFHYLFHPLTTRAAELLSDGAIGRLERIEVRMSMPTPPAGDPRWSFGLAGGALMDLGCYALHVMRVFGRFAGGTPEVVAARPSLFAPEVDAACAVDLAYPERAEGDRATGYAWVSMVGDRYEFSVEFLGSAGSVVVPDFLGPQRDDRVIVRRAGAPEVVERLDATSTYTFQLAAFAAAVHRGALLPIGVDDAVANMELLDAAYRAAGLSPR